MLTRGRLWVLVTLRSASSNATGLEAMLLPRSACKVNCLAGTFSAVMVAAISCSASVADSLVATIHPTALRLKTSPVDALGPAGRSLPDPGRPPSIRQLTVGVGRHLHEQDQICPGGGRRGLGRCRG